MRTTAPAAAPIFRSEQQMRILAALFERRGVELSVSELAQAAGVAIGTASREVERLVAHGLVTSRNVGRSRFVSANWELVWADALATILAHSAASSAKLNLGPFAVATTPSTSPLELMARAARAARSTPTAAPGGSPAPTDPSDRKVPAL